MNTLTERGFTNPGSLDHSSFVGWMNRPLARVHVSHERLVGAMWELCDIESQINRWFEQRNAQVSAWEKSVKDNPPQRVI